LISFRKSSLCQDQHLTRSVLNERRRPIGYLNVKAIKEKFEKGQASQVRSVAFGVEIR
jgi:hypothetical protein